MTNRNEFVIIYHVAGMAQSVEHVIGNDEVISSILITSSKQKREAKASRFCLELDSTKKNCTSRAKREKVVLREGRGINVFCRRKRKTQFRF